MNQRESNLGWIGIRGPAWTFVGVSAAADLLMPMMVQESEALAAIMLGVLLGQAAVISVWAVFGAERGLVRWPGCMLVAMFLYGSLATGLIVGGGGATIGEAAAAMMLLPLGFLGAQVPLLIVRVVTGWRIVVAGREYGSWLSRSRQFGLQDMFAVTTALAVGLGLTSAGMRLLGADEAGEFALVWLAMLVYPLVCGVWNLLWALPCLWAAFIARDKAVATAVICFCAVAISMLPLLAIVVLAGPPPTAELIVAGGLLVLFDGGLMCVLLGSLHILRLAGYVLLRPGRRQQTGKSPGSSPFAQVTDESSTES